jgi:hypothetical protein
VRLVFLRKGSTANWAFLWGSGGLYCFLDVLFFPSMRLLIAGLVAGYDEITIVSLFSSKAL